MSWTTSLAIYFIIWWISLFLVLPFGIRSQAEGEAVGDGTDPGAPAITGLKLKLAAATVLAAVIFGLFYWIYTRGLVSLDDMTTMWGLLKWRTLK